MRRKDFFADYERVPSGLENAKRKRGSLVYTGPYFTFSLSEQALKKHKMILLLLHAALIALLIGLGLIPANGIWRAYVMVPYVLLYFPVLMGLMDVLLFLPMKQKMTRHADHSYHQIKACATGELFLSAALLVGFIISVVQQGLNKPEIIFGFTLCVFSLLAFFLKKQMKETQMREQTTQESPNQPVVKS